MYLRELTQSVSTLKGAGPSICARLARLGIYSVADLLLRAPRDYEDRSRAVSFREALKTGSPANTVGIVAAHDWFGYGRSRTLKILVDDGSATAALVCFNRAFLADRHPPGSRVRVTGTLALRFNELQSASFEIEAAAEGQGPEAGILPIYPLTDGLAQGTVRRLAARALSEYGRRAEDELPVRVRELRGLPHKARALEELHAPSSPEAAEQAHRALAYEELFYLQILVRRRAAARAERPVDRPSAAPDRAGLRSRLVERLPFRLTPDQERVAAEIAADMERPRPMARLLQGDVGSGKTLVAFLAVLKAVESGGQAALMAPTELLARQHAQTAARLLEPLGVRLAFLTGNLKDASRRPLLAALAAGEVDLVLGTHALFSEDVEYRRLALAVVDEQHRFGVLQRLALARKGGVPDLLMMSATPIPRTLALTVYGDLEVSTIRTMPPGRKPVITHLARQGNESKVYEFVRKELAQGRQAYFVYPLITESEASELKNAQDMARNLAEKVYPGIPGGLIHSRLPDEEKRSVMEAFTRGELRYLVATSVVEVGVDVAAATCMVIEHAERFGLAALHQLRGRVGRSDAQSYCFLVYSGNLTEDGKRRLKAMMETTDGFLLAEEDLRIRGPGEIAGIAQSGSLRLAFADPVRDADLLEAAREDAARIVERDPGLLEPEHRVIREVLERANPFPAESSGA